MIMLMETQEQCCYSTSAILYHDSIKSTEMSIISGKSIYEELQSKIFKDMLIILFRLNLLSLDFIASAAW